MVVSIDRGLNRSRVVENPRDRNRVHNQVCTDYMEGGKGLASRLGFRVEGLGFGLHPFMIQEL